MIKALRHGNGLSAEHSGSSYLTDCGRNARLGPPHPYGCSCSSPRLPFRRGVAEAATERTGLETNATEHVQG